GHDATLADFDNPWPSRLMRDAILNPFATSQALAVERAVGAIRLLRRANKRPQLHQRLIEVADALVGQYGRGCLPEPPIDRGGFRIARLGEEPAEHPRAVRFDHRQSTVERLRQHRCEDVPADAAGSSGSAAPCVSTNLRAARCRLRARL